MCFDISGSSVVVKIVMDDTTAKARLDKCNTPLNDCSIMS